jgi:integrase
VARLMLGSGLRVSEGVGLEWADIHLEPVNGARFGYLHLRDGKSRNARRNVPLTTDVRAMLETRSESVHAPWVFSDERNIGPLSSSTVSHQHTKLRRDLKFPEGFVLHSFRHTFGTRLGAAGIDSFSIKKLMGHSSVAVSEKYIHPTPESLMVAFDRLESYTAEAVKALPKVIELLPPATIPATVAGEQIGTALQTA